MVKYIIIHEAQNSELVNIKCRSNYYVKHSIINWLESLNKKKFSRGACYITRWHVRLHKLSWFHELGKSGPHGHQSSEHLLAVPKGNLMRFNANGAWQNMRMWWSGSTRKHDNGFASTVSDSVILCGCFVKQTARGRAYWQALLSC